MLLESQNLSVREAYKLLTSTIVPRPIALVTSLNREGIVNAAPFSFFNVMGSNPPILALGVGDRDEDTPKDTALNIENRGEFVVNLVSEALAEPMNICAINFPHDVSEVDAAELRLEPSRVVAVPRLAQTPVAFECRHHTTSKIGRNRIIFGEVVAFYIADEFFDAEKMYVSFRDLHLIGRAGGPGGYVRTTDSFEMERPDLASWLQSKNR